MDSENKKNSDSWSIEIGLKDNNKVSLRDEKKSD